MHAFVKCHVTQEEYAIDVPTSPREMAKYWRWTITTHCPHCGQKHLAGFRQLYAQAALGGEWKSVFEAPPPPGARKPA
jgi:hypothetical protein